MCVFICHEGFPRKHNLKTQPLSLKYPLIIHYLPCLLMTEIKSTLHDLMTRINDALHVTNVTHRRGFA